MIIPPAIDRALVGGGGVVLGALVTLVCAYFALGKSISNELHFLKGQLTMVLQQLAILQAVRERLADHQSLHAKSKTDLDYAHEKIRNLERTLSNGHARNP